MTTKTFFTSDTHFNHANVIRYCNRPFASLDEMNRAMIERWNAVVGPADTVYHLGDFAMGKATEWPSILPQLNGARKIILIGSHDRKAAQMLSTGFTEAYDTLEWNGWLLQHKPFKTDRKLLCGHVHEKWLRLGSIINVGVDVWDFTPRTIEELVQAPQSPRDYPCPFCGLTLQRLEDNRDHYDGKCGKQA